MDSSFMQAYREKKAKLANPNFFVSKTRYMYILGIKWNGGYLHLHVSNERVYQKVSCYGME